MMKYACKDLGLNCSYVAIGANKEEVLKKAIRHGGTAHGDMMKKLSREELVKFSKQLEVVIKRV